MQERCYPRPEQNCGFFHNVLAFFSDTGKKTGNAMPRHKKAYYGFYTATIITIVVLSLFL